MTDEIKIETIRAAIEVIRSFESRGANGVWHSEDYKLLEQAKLILSLHFESCLKSRDG